MNKKDDHPIFGWIKCNKTDLAIESLSRNKDIIHIRSSRNDLPLQTACQYGRAEIVDHLLQLGADADQIDRSACTPLIVALINRKRRIIDRLILWGVDVNKGITTYGRNPLQIAVIQNNRSLVKTLLENGADPLKQTVHNRDSTLTIAKRHADYEIYEMIRNAIKNKEKRTYTLQEICFVTCINESIETTNIIPKYIIRDSLSRLRNRPSEDSQLTQKFAHARRRHYAQCNKISRSL